MFAQAREKARQATCASNQKQICMAVFAYADDYDDALPFLAYNDRNHLGDDWQISTRPYIKSADVWQCPSASDYAASGVFSRSFGLPFMLEPSGYAYNETAAAHTTPGQIDADGPTNQKAFAPAVQSECGHPTQTLFLMDKGGGALFTPWTQWRIRVQSTAVVDDTFVPGPHTGGKNVAFADGHVRFYPAPALVTRDQHPVSGVAADPKSALYSYFAN